MANLNNITGADGWKVRIERLPYMDLVEIYMYRSQNGRTDILGADGIARTFPEGWAVQKSEIKPLLSLTGFNAKAMMIALAEAISEEGVRTPDSHRLQGTLDAQAKHLEDLRTLLKLNKSTSGR